MLNRKNILILLKGSIIAQFLPILTYPILTRIYSASDYGYFNTILSLITTLTVVVVIKLDQAIPIAKNEEKERILRGSFYISILIVTLIYIFLQEYQSFFDLNDLSILMIVLAVFLNGFINLMISLNISNGRFNFNSNNQILRSIILSFSQILLGLMGIFDIGLIIAFIVAQIISLIFLISKNKKEVSNILKFSELINDFNLIKEKFMDFPVYLTPTSLINTIGVTLPILLFTSFYGLFNSGIYGLVSRIFLTPLNMISLAIAQPLLKEMSDKQSSLKDIQKSLIKSFKLLSLISVFPLSVFMFNFEYIFSVLFSKEWIKAGGVAALIIPWVSTNFILSPLTNVYTILRKQNINFILNIITVIIRIVIIFISYKMEINFLNMIIIFGISNFILSIVQLFFIFKISNLNTKLIFYYLVFPMIIGGLLSYCFTIIFTSILSILMTTLLVGMYLLYIIKRLDGGII